MHLSGKYGINEVCSRRPVFQFLFFKVAVLYGFDLSQVFTLIILRLYQPHSLCEKGATRAAAKAALYVFLLTPLREGRLIPEATMKRAAKLFLLAPLREGRPQPSILDVARGVFLLAPLREGRQQFFTKPQVDLYDKFLKIHIFQINTFCILQHSFENFKDYFVGSARTSRKNVYGKGWR